MGKWYAECLATHPPVPTFGWQGEERDSEEDAEADGNIHKTMWPTHTVEVQYTSL
jgi:hypothetical protein